MDVRSPARRRCALAAIAVVFVCCSGCQWLKSLLDDPTPLPEPRSGPNMAQLWEDGYGYNNPNGELIRSGKKKPGDQPKKGKNPFYREQDRDDRSSSKKPEFAVEEPVFDFR